MARQGDRGLHLTVGALCGSWVVRAPLPLSDSRVPGLRFSMLHGLYSQVSGIRVLPEDRGRSVGQVSSKYLHVMNENLNQGAAK